MYPAAYTTCRNIGISCEKLEKRDEAISWYFRSIEVKNTYDEAYKSLANLYSKSYTN